MPVTDEMVDAFRAYLSGDKDGFKLRNDALDRSRPARQAYRALMIGLFVTAVERRFPTPPTWERRIEFVAELRARDQEVADALDPETTERVIASVFDDKVDTDDVKGRRAIRVWMLVTDGIIADADLDAPALEAFLAKARAFAGELLDGA